MNGGESDVGRRLVTVLVTDQSWRLMVDGGRKKTPRDRKWLQMRCAQTKSAAGEMQVDLAFAFIRVNSLILVGWLEWSKVEVKGLA
jgi:hypothetical protein